MRILFFDLETRKDPGELSDDIQEGWDRLREGKGGISALVIYDSEMDWVYLYDDNSLLTAARHLEAADLVVSFCGSKFDIFVIEGILGRKLQLKHHLDLYVEISSESARRHKVGRKGDFTLNAICSRTLGKTKSGNGAMVTQLLNENKVADVFNYCSQDVKLTKELFDHIKEHGGCQGLNNTFLPVPLPEWVKKAVN